MHHSPFRRRQPDWWRQTAYSRTKLLYQPATKPVVYIIPVKDILGRLALVLLGVHGTIPYAWRQLQGSNYPHYPRGICDHQDQPGSGSKLYYIDWWAMTWSSDQPHTELDDKWVLLCTWVHLIKVNLPQQFSCVLEYTNYICQDILCTFDDFFVVLMNNLSTLVTSLVPWGECRKLQMSISQQPTIGFGWTKRHAV